MIETTLQEKLKELMGARDYVAEAQGAFKESIETWEAREGRQLKEAVDTAKKIASALDTEIRELALAEYRESGEKKPTPGVEIKMDKVVNYSPDLAMEWAQEHKLALIPESLDKKKYQALVLSGDAPGMITEEPVAQIAQNLPKALKGD